MLDAIEGGMDAAMLAATLWQPQGGRRGGGRSEALRRLVQSDGDFSPEDYETLLELDHGRGGAEEAVRRRSLIEALPVSSVRNGDRVEQCAICLEDMGPRAKVKTLPCMHKFHCKCIDKWLKKSGGQEPRCPVDQAPVTLAPPETAAAPSRGAVASPDETLDVDEGVVCIS